MNRPQAVLRELSVECFEIHVKELQDGTTFQDNQGITDCVFGYVRVLSELRDDSRRCEQPQNRTETPGPGTGPQRDEREEEMGRV